MLFPAKTQGIQRLCYTPQWCYLIEKVQNPNEVTERQCLPAQRSPLS